MTILYFYQVLLICFLLVFTYLLTNWHIPLLIPFSTINDISMFVNSSNFTSFFFKVASNANHGTDRNFAGPKWFFKRFQKQQRK